MTSILASARFGALAAERAWEPIADAITSLSTPAPPNDAVK
jgi:hypothetical protein